MLSEYNGDKQSIARLWEVFNVGRKTNMPRCFRSYLTLHEPWLCLDTWGDGVRMCELIGDEECTVLEAKEDEEDEDEEEENEENEEVGETPHEVGARFSGNLYRSKQTSMAFSEMVDKCRQAGSKTLAHGAASCPEAVYLAQHSLVSTRLSPIGGRQFRRLERTSSFQLAADFTIPSLLFNEAPEPPLLVRKRRYRAYDHMDPYENEDGRRPPPPHQPALLAAEKARLQALPIRERLVSAYHALPESIDEINLWVSGGTTHSSSHYDEYFNLLCLVSGRKRVRLAPPDCSNVFSPHPISHVSANHSSLSWRNANAVWQSLLTQKRAYEVTLERGDALFIPFGWWHQVMSSPSALDGSPLVIAINFWMPHMELEEAMASHELTELYLRRSLQELVKRERLTRLASIPLGHIPQSLLQVMQRACRKSAPNPHAWLPLAAKELDRVTRKALQKPNDSSPLEHIAEILLIPVLFNSSRIQGKDIELDPTLRIPGRQLFEGAHIWLRLLLRQSPIHVLKSLVSTLLTPTIAALLVRNFEGMNKNQKFIRDIEAGRPSASGLVQEDLEPNLDEKFFPWFYDTVAMDGKDSRDAVFTRILAADQKFNDDCLVAVLDQHKPPK